MQELIFIVMPLVTNGNGSSFVTPFIGGLFHCTCLVASAELVTLSKIHFPNQAYWIEILFFLGCSKQKTLSSDTFLVARKAA